MTDPFPPSLPPQTTQLTQTAAPAIHSTLPPHHPFFNRVDDRDAKYFHTTNLEMRHLAESIKFINIYSHFSTSLNCDEDMMNPCRPSCNHAEFWCILEDGSDGDGGAGGQGSAQGFGEAVSIEVLPGVCTINPHTRYPDEELPAIVRIRVFRRTDWTVVDDRCLVVSEWRKEVAAAGPDIKEEEEEPALSFDEPGSSTSAPASAPSGSGPAGTSKAWKALDGVFPSRGWQSKADPPLTPLYLSKKVIPEGKNIIHIPEGEVLYEYERRIPPRPPQPVAVCLLEGPIQQDWTVWDFIRLILNGRRHKYRFTTLGIGRAGCRHWIYAVCHDLEREGVVSPGYTFKAKEHLEGCHVPVYRQDGQALSLEVRWVVRAAKKPMLPGSFVELY